MFHTKDRAAVETAGARIGLASLVLVMDAGGAYRASQTYLVDNSVEQFLEVQLPAGAELWTAHVAGEAVKPTAVPGTKTPGQVRIPLIKTAAGERDFAVVLKYGGRMASLGTLRSVKFPVMRTVNINVELSKVQLYLPESYDWFMFGGTMRRVDDQAELAAVDLSYETRQLERLGRALQSSNEYTQARAKANLKNNLKQLSVPTLSQVESSNLFANQNYRQELDTNARLQKQVEAQIAEQQAKPMEQLELDNRMRLNDLVENQRITRSRNTVTEQGGNFDASGLAIQPAQPLGDQSRFNAKWLQQNGLENPDTKSININQADGKVWEELSKRRKRYAANELPTSEAPKPGEPNAPAQQGQPLSGRSQADQPAAPEVAQGKAKKQVQQLEAAKEAQQPMSRGLSNKAELYEKKLESQTANQPGQAAAQPDQSKPDAKWAEVNGPGSVKEFRGNLSLQIDQSQTVTEGIAFHDRRADDATKSLASLDVAIPTPGTAYSFTTPRGEVEITAEAVYSPLVSRLVRLLIALAILAVTMVVYRALGRRRNHSDTAPSAAVAELPTP